MSKFLHVNNYIKILFSILCFMTYMLTSCTPAEKKEDWSKIEPIATGKIMTKVDGTDVKEVNLWSSTLPDRSIVCSMREGWEVRILKDAHPYYLVESTIQIGCTGYCLKGFVVVDETL